MANLVAIGIREENRYVDRMMKKYIYRTECGTIFCVVAGRGKCPIKSDILQLTSLQGVMERFASSPNAVKGIS